MKKVILSLAIAGLCVSSSCYGSQWIMKDYSVVTVLNNKQEVSKFRANGQSPVLADVNEISTLDYIKLRVAVKLPVLKRRLKTAAVVGAWTAVGIGVGAGVVAYYTSPSFHGLVDGLVGGATSFPGTAFNYIKSRPHAIVNYVNGLGNPFVGIGRAAMHGIYGGAKYGYEALKFIGRSAQWTSKALLMNELYE